MSDRLDPISLHVLDAVEWFMRRLEAEHAAHLEESDEPAIRGSQGRILHMLPKDGARATDLASGGWITKQAIGQRVQELEEMGLVVTEPDPADGRARIVRRTEAGDRVEAGLTPPIDAMEARWAEEVGQERYAIFRTVLDELGAAHAPALFGREPPPSAPAP